MQTRWQKGGVHWHTISPCSATLHHLISAMCQTETTLLDSGVRGIGRQTRAQRKDTGTWQAGSEGLWL